MNRIDKKFKELRKQGKKAFIVYITGGYPSLAATEALVPELERSGVDLIEIGIPFSDPIADGPVIQHASSEALAKGATMRRILKSVGNIRRKSAVPIVFMSYYNPINRYGLERFVVDASGRGVDGVIIPDMPPEESGRLLTAARRKDFAVIFLASPTSTNKRLKEIAGKTRGFIYYVSLTGVTGTRKRLAADIAKNIKKIKAFSDKPVCVGFGVSNEEQARRMAHVSDGVIVGSAIIKAIEKYRRGSALRKGVGGLAARLGRAVHGE